MIKVQIAWIDDSLQAKSVVVKKEKPIAWLSLLKQWRPGVDWVFEKKMNKLLLWSEKFPDDYMCEDGDRFEWVRPLICDPKEARKKRLGN